MKKKLLFGIMIVVFVLINTIVIFTSADNAQINLRILTARAQNNPEASSSGGLGGNDGDQFCPGSYRQEYTKACSSITIYNGVGSTNWNAGGSGNVGYGGWGVNVEGSYGSSNSSNSYTQSTGTWTATGVNCIPRYSLDQCTSHNPC